MALSIHDVIEEVGDGGWGSVSNTCSRHKKRYMKNNNEGGGWGDLKMPQNSKTLQLGITWLV